MRARIGFAGAIAVALAAAALPAQAQQQGNAMPPGDGRDLVAVACTQCHGLNTVLQLRENADGWRSLVDYMVLHGAQLTKSESDTAVDYLATNFGPGINVPKPEMSVTLPDGPGKDLVETRCVVCHGLDHIAAAKRSPVRLGRRAVAHGVPGRARLGRGEEDNRRLSRRQIRREIMRRHRSSGRGAAQPSAPGRSRCHHRRWVSLNFRSASSAQLCAARVS